ncbi:MAG: exodeoxyribonuclease V subunit gamma, partial [Chthoniobacteraceae bacterium]
MAGLYLHRSNRLETLADELARILRKPLANVFAADMVVVQSLGMRRWLSLELAGRLGVTMNCEFPFPAGFSHRLFRAIAPGLKPDSAFDREVLPWRILSALGDLLSEPGSEPLRRYVNGEMDDVKLYQLAMQLTEVFDRYLVFRAEKLLEWQDDRKAGDWQAKLWRELTRGRGEEHPPALLRKLLAHTSAGGGLPGIPERLCVFGVSNLPPFHLQVLNAAARSVDVHLFLFEPTEQYWGDVQSPREQERFLRKHASETQTAEDFHLDAGNSLLASLGRPGRAFSQALLELEAHGENAAFSEPEGDSVLSRLQRDIYELRDGADLEEPIAADDLSLQVHCCHGPMREVEVLHDQLLNLFEKLPGLSPKDILVTMPDIETYAPFIEAVFGSPEDDRVRIPFTIADRQVAADDTVSTAFLQLLALQKSRFTAPEVISILEAAPIRRRFGLEESELSTIRAWVAENAIRWGIDAAHRETFDLPAEVQNTWRAGLDRLLLGYAMSGDEDATFGGILPSPDIEGDLADLLGNFAQFCDQLFTRLLALGKARSLREWETALRELLDAFFDDRDESADSVRRLRSAFEQMGNMETHHPGDVSFDVAQAHLRTVIEQGHQGFGFLAGRATFCSLKPMRSVPFRVICLLGMSDTAFPRQDTGLSFDLMTGEPRPGDRSRRDDDRQLFLESLLSARHCLYLSYPGRSQRDHSETPPSVVVAELLDYVDAAYPGSDGEPARAQIVTKHRLQPFSPEYFREGSRLFSYSAENSRANDRRGKEASDPAPFLTAPLPPPDADFLRVDLQQLTRFLCHPARHFLKERLGISLPGEHDALQDSEPMSLDPLTSTRLRDTALQQLLKGAAGEDTLRLARAKGELPHGWNGDFQHGELQREAKGVLKQLEPLLQKTPLEPVSIELQLGRWTLTGTLRDVYPAGAVRFRASSIKAKDYLRAWVQHLALNALPSHGIPRNTVLVGTDKSPVEFRPIMKAPALLEDLLELYGTGFTEPIAFFPKAS